MRPHQPNPRAAAKSRARLYLKRDLGWVRGFPGSSVHWHTVPPGAAREDRPLDGELLRRSQRTLNLLRREFPKELPRLVGDVERFAAVHRALLDALKPTIHEGAPLPVEPLAAHPGVPNAVLREARRSPVSAQLRGALEWYCFTDPNSLGPALRWLEAHQDRVTVIERNAGDSARDLLLRLWQLVERLNRRRVEPLLALLGSPALWTQRTEIAHGYIEALAARVQDPSKKAPKTPPQPLPNKLLEWIELTAQADRATQKRTLELFALLIDPTVPMSWERFWVRLNDRYERASRMPDENPSLEAKRRRAGERLERLEENLPPALPFRVIEGSLRRLPNEEALQRVAVRALNRIPRVLEGAPARLAFAEHWSGLWASPRYRGERLLRHLAAFSVYLRDANDVMRALAPWRAVWVNLQRGRGSVAYTVDQDVLEELTTRKSLELFFRVLGEQSDPVDPTTAETLCTLVATLPEPRVRGALDRLRDAGLQAQYFDPATVRLAGALTDACPARFAQMVKTLNDSEERYGDLEEVLHPLVRRFHDADAADLLADSVLDGGIGTMMDLAYQCAVLREHGQRVPSVWPSHSTDIEWYADYPAALEPALARLARADPDAAGTAGKLLRKEYPSHAELRAEIGKLESLEARSAAQERRLENRRDRLRAPRAVSSKRLQNLAEKLRAAARRRLIEGFAERVRASYLSLLPERWGVDAVPDWMSEHRVLSALLPIRKLDGASRRLAERILKRRAGPPPYDLRDAPRNAKFIARMTERGLDLGPWLDDPRPREFRAKDRQLVLSLERDPLEVLHMGGHFNTCLSPGQFNFFSVFSNIADVNKQVLYARTPDGAVFGRVLLALTDVGGLVAFHVYAHDSRIGFDAIVMEYVNDLARAIGTLVVPEGEISTLVAPRWYDDGPVDLSARIAAFAEGSALRRTLPKLPPEALLERVVEALMPLELNELTLPMLIALPEVVARPELAARLLPLARRFELPLEALNTLLGATGEADGGEVRPLVDRLFQLAKRRVGHYFPYDAGLLLARLAPAAALRLVRETRPREVRRWRDEEDGGRLFIAAEACRRLGRRNDAITLYELALRAERGPIYEKQCRAALSELRVA